MLGGRRRRGVRKERLGSSLLLMCSSAGASSWSSSTAASQHYRRTLPPRARRRWALCCVLVVVDLPAPRTEDASASRSAAAGSTMRARRRWHPRATDGRLRLTLGSRSFPLHTRRAAASSSLASPVRRFSQLSARRCFVWLSS